jgi:DNA-binding HxlR family transcriptional regulator
MTRPVRTARSEAPMKEIKVAGDTLKATLRKLIREGNVRRIIVRNVPVAP